MAFAGVRRLLIVEDTEIVATGLRATLEEDAANVVVAIVDSVSGALQAIRPGEIDVIIVDVRLADGTAFDLLKQLASQDDPPPSLIVSSFDLAQYVDAALRLGASGYILKTALASELLSAVQTVAAGGWAFDPELVRGAHAAKQLGLSIRDRNVIERVLAGRSNDEIGVDLGISRKTVEAHISRLFVRFGVASRVELARRAEREQWLEATTTAASVGETNARGESNARPP